MTSYIARCGSDWLYTDKRVYVDARLREMPSAQAGVKKAKDGTIFLISYETKVAELSADGWFHCYGTFSATTRRHIGAFLKEYAPSLCYYDAKRCYEKDEEINALTGEVRKAGLGMVQTCGVAV